MLKLINVDGGQFLVDFSVCVACEVYIVDGKIKHDKLAKDNYNNLIEQYHLQRD